MQVCEVEATRVVADHGSTGLTAGLLAGSDTAAATVLRLEPGGRIGRHPAPVPQLLLVVSGTAEVSGEDQVVHLVGPGSAVWWAAGEDHETRSTDGLLAVALEGAGLELA